MLPVRISDQAEALGSVALAVVAFSSLRAR
jgi:hypothetical protein